MEEVEEQLQPRYQFYIIKVPQTRSLHSFIPVNLTIQRIRIAYFSEDLKKLVSIRKFNLNAPLNNNQKYMWPEEKYSKNRQFVLSIGNYTVF